jgi:phosphoenolpyruvate carboxykinase (GTP)
MKPFCGYNMGDYFEHWFSMGEKLASKAPKIFYVNWFRKSQDGKFLWPGFSDNSRVLKWICERVDNKVGAEKSAVGLLPKEGDLDLSGLTLTPESMKELMSINADEWKNEIPDIEAHFTTFGKRMPQKLRDQLEELRKRLG